MRSIPQYTPPDILNDQSQTSDTLDLVQILFFSHPLRAAEAISPAAFIFRTKNILILHPSPSAEEAIFRSSPWATSHHRPSCVNRGLPRGRPDPKPLVLRTCLLHNLFISSPEHIFTQFPVSPQNHLQTAAQRRCTLACAGVVICDNSNYELIA